MILLKLVYRAIVSQTSSRTTEALQFIVAAEYILNPNRILQIPLNRLAKTGGMTLPWTPVELALYLGCVDRVTEIVARPICYESNPFRVRASIRSRAQLVQLRTKQTHQIDVPPLIIASDIVSLADSTPRDYSMQGLGMVFHVQPITNIFSFAIDRNRFVSKRLQDYHRDELLGELERAIIIGAIGYQNG
jgi:hypothetical protein